MDNTFDLSEILRVISLKMEIISNWVNDYLSSLTGTEIAAMILLLIAVIMALSLAIMWYVKSIVSSIQEEKKKQREFINKFDNRLDKKIVVDDMDLGDEETDDEIGIKGFVKSKLKGKKTKMNMISAPSIDLDWERGRRKKENSIKFVSPDALSYQLKPYKLTELLGLIIDLLERGVDEPKIAQSIMHKNQHLNTEDEIIQTIIALKFFIYLCVSGRFQNMDTKVVLPQEDAALFHLANADGSLSMALLENLIDKNLKKIKTAYNGKERDKLFNETSNLATIFGSIAYFNNPNLAAKAFELAIESNPRNITAWGRLADMYNAVEDTEKAVWAYRNVLSIADDGLFAQQAANANKMLSIYYSENGNRDQAKIMMENSNRYYDSIGINQPLTEKEAAALDIIETNRINNMEAIIEKLFNSKNFKQTSYV